MTVVSKISFKWMDSASLLGLRLTVLKTCCKAQKFKKLGASLQSLLLQEVLVSFQLKGERQSKIKCLNQH